MSTKSFQIIDKEVALNKEVKKSIAYVLSGNFLEYFDLMLVTHLAYIISPYFTPKGNPTLEKTVALFAFLSSFIIRPLAAVFWGKIGDTLGRVFVLSWTTLLMALSCAVIVLIPPYEVWGMYSVYCFLFARALQGISSSGEGAAADIFCTELVKPPTVYRICAGLTLASNFAGLVALLISIFCVNIGENGWQYCFYFGGTIAVCAMNFRRKLKETKEFLDAHLINDNKILSALKEKFLRRNFLCLVGLNISASAGFVFGYGYCTSLLKTIGLTDTQILFNNACIVLIEIITIFIFAWLTYFFQPLSLLRWRGISSFFIIPFSFCLLYFSHSHMAIFIAQLCVLLPIQGLDPALPIFIKGFHPRKRFTNYSLSWALSKSVTYLTTGILVTFLETQLGLYGLLIFLLMSSTIFLFSLNRFVPEDKMKIIANQTTHKRNQVVDSNHSQNNIVSNLSHWLKE